MRAKCLFLVCKKGSQHFCWWNIIKLCEPMHFSILHWTIFPFESAVLINLLIEIGGAHKYKGRFNRYSFLSVRRRQNDFVPMFTVTRGICQKKPYKRFDGCYFQYSSHHICHRFRGWHLMVMLIIRNSVATMFQCDFDTMWFLKWYKIEKYVHKTVWICCNQNFCITSWMFEIVFKFEFLRAFNKDASHL